MAEEKKADPKPFVVRPFAVMRLTHEAVRAGMKSVGNALKDVAEDCSNVDDIKNIYSDLVRCIAVHAKQEDDVFFPLLDKGFENIVTKKGIPAQHEADAPLRNKISVLLDKGCDTKKQLSEAIDAWLKHHEAHLKCEEDVMMPLTPKTADTTEERGSIVRNIINVDRKEFNEFQFEYVLRQLVQTKPFGPVMMYCKAVQMASNVEEYAAVKGKIAGIVGDETWKKLQSKGVDEDGKQK
eukprot:256157_1